MTPGSIKAHRESLGLSQAALAREIGVHPGTYGQWERGVCRVPPARARDVLDLVRERGAVTPERLMRLEKRIVALEARARHMARVNAALRRAHSSAHTEDQIPDENDTDERKFSPVEVETGRAEAQKEKR